MSSPAHKYKIERDGRNDDRGNEEADGDFGLLAPAGGGGVHEAEAVADAEEREAELFGEGEDTGWSWGIECGEEMEGGGSTYIARR